MKRKLILASIVLVGLAATGFAKDQTSTSQRAAMLAMKSKKRTAMLAKFDTNKDGTLDESERLAMREQRIERRFAKLDTNNDGVITLAEMKAAKPAKRGKRGGSWGRSRGPKLVK